MLTARLEVLKPLLSRDGSIWISIDDDGIAVPCPAYILPCSDKVAINW